MSKSHTAISPPGDLAPREFHSPSTWAGLGLYILSPVTSLCCHPRNSFYLLLSKTPVSWIWCLPISWFTPLSYWSAPSRSLAGLERWYHANDVVMTICLCLESHYSDFNSCLSCLGLPDTSLSLPLASCARPQGFLLLFLYNFIIEELSLPTLILIILKCPTF